MKICVICGKEHNGVGLTCSNSCRMTMQLLKRSGKSIEQYKKEKDSSCKRICSKCGKELPKRARSSLCNECRNPIKKCIICGRGYKGRGQTCSRSCTAKFHLMNKGGSPFARKDVQEKSKKTMIERYGVPYAQMNEEIKDKTRESEGAQRTKFKKGQDFKDFCINKFGVDNPQKDKNIRNKTTETMNEKYGGNAPLSSKKIMSKAIKTSLSYNRCEQEIKDYIKNLDPDIRIISNTKDLLVNPNTNCRLELDIYLPDYNLAIECMGTYFHDYNIFPEKEKRDKLKFSLCKDKGIELIQIWTNKINEGKQILKDRVSHSSGEKMYTKD